ncbi:MAG: AIPR family protein, partial [Candidatus Bathyarchaeia archaeon]
KNIRGYVGKKAVNKEISKGLAGKESKLFFFKNSGVTILADEVVPITKKEGQEPGFQVKDIQVVNGQQTIRVLSEKRHRNAVVLVIFIAPIKTLRDIYDKNEEVPVKIIEARNFQNKIGYADLKSNHHLQVELGNKFKELGYYYERKKHIWKNYDESARSLYPLAHDNPRWAVIKKNELAASIFASLADPQHAFLGVDYIYREHYSDIFPEKLFPTEWYLAIYLLWKRYVHKVGLAVEDTYPQYHVLRMLLKQLGVTRENAPSFRGMFEKEKLDANLLRAIRQLYYLSRLVVAEYEKKSKKELGSNGVFSKKTGVLREMNKIYGSKKFASKRKIYLDNVKKFKKKLSKESRLNR